MSGAKPLTREERDRVQAVIIYWNDEPQPDEEFNYDRMSARYEATVRAVEAERDAAVARAEKLRERIAANRDPDCGCQTCTDLGRALAADDAERGDL